MAKPRPTKRTRPSRPKPRRTGPGPEIGAATEAVDRRRDASWRGHSAPARGFNPGFKRR